MKKQLLSTLLILCMMITLLPNAALAAELKAGDTAFATIDHFLVRQTEATTSPTVHVLSKGDKVTVLEAYINGSDKKNNFHKVEVDSNIIGYVVAYEYGKYETLISEAAQKKAEEEKAAAEKAAAEKEAEKIKGDVGNNGDLFQHSIDMTVLADYIYGGSKTTSGTSYTYGYVSVPDEWTRHGRPKELPRVGRAVLHIGDLGKEGKVEAAFYPGKPPINYHEQRLDDLDAIGWGLAFERGSNLVFANDSNANTAFYAYTGSEYDVVAYNDTWVAVWDRGGVDTSQGLGNPCGGIFFAQYGSWKPGVYFFPRENCYILDINNQLAEAPKNTASGKATCPLLIKTSPDAKDYVKSGVYKTNQSFPIIDPTPVDGHYKVYYRQGAYYVNASFVNITLANTAKPTLTHTAKVKNSDYDYINIRSEANKNSESIGKVKKGAVIEIIQKDFDDTYSKIWFNSRESYIDKSFLTSVKELPSASRPNTPAKGKSRKTSAKTQTIYVDTDKYDVLAYNINDNNYFKLRDIAKILSSSSKRFDIKYDSATNSIEMLSLFDYTEVGGELAKGDGQTRTAQPSSAFLMYDGVPISAACYNIDGNNYFKLRDITDAIDCRVDWNEQHKVIQITTTVSKEDPNEAKG